MHEDSDAIALYNGQHPQLTQSAPAPCWILPNRSGRGGIGIAPADSEFPPWATTAPTLYFFPITMPARVAAQLIQDAGLA